MSVTATNTFGELLRHWRELRRISQLELGLEAEVSSRHISFIETGRATPSREMVMTLAAVLDIPLRERNVLLQSAGYAPLYRETSLDAPEMAEVRHALELILKQQQPFGAIVFDRYWDLLMANESYVMLSNLLLPHYCGALVPYCVTAMPRLNLMKLIFDPTGWRPHIKNWPRVAHSTLSRLHRDATRDQDTRIAALIDEILAYPDVPQKWRKPDFDMPQDLVIPVELGFYGETVRLFSTITTMGSPQDITLQELHIEAMHPADEASAQLIRNLAG
jgi:transcriptional regulator with XRE-family HTH domain